MTKSAILVMMILRTIIMNAGEMKRHRDTVWKFYYFSITQNLREINFEDSRGAKSAIFTQFWFNDFLHFWKVDVYTKLTKFWASKMAKMPVLELLHSPQLISRKIWMTVWKSIIKRDQHFYGKINIFSSNQRFYYIYNSHAKTASGRLPLASPSVLKDNGTQIRTWDRNPDIFGQRDTIDQK